LVEADALASAFEDQTRPQWMREADALAAELEDQLRLHTEAEAESPLVRVQDVPITVSRALLSVPEAAVGLADIVTAGKAAPWLEETFGINPSQTKRELAALYSARQRLANRAVAEAGENADSTLGKWLDTAAAAIQNPSVVLNTVVESLPLMYAGGHVARGVLGLRAGAGAAGEAMAQAGTFAAEARAPGEELSMGDIGMAVGSGAVTGAIGRFGSGLARKLKIRDADTLLAGAASDPVASKNLTTAVLKGMFQEGFLEELPQSMQEQVWANWQAGRPLEEGIPQAAVLGFLAGSVTGGASQLGALEPAVPPPTPPSPPPVAAPRQTTPPVVRGPAAFGVGQEPPVQPPVQAEPLPPPPPAAPEFVPPEALPVAPVELPEPVLPTVAQAAPGEPTRLTLYRGGSVEERGAWHTPDKAAAREYAMLAENPRVEQVEVSWSNVAGPTEIRQAAADVGAAPDQALYWLLTPDQSNDAPKVLARLREQGFEAVHLPSGEDFSPSGKGIESFLFLGDELPPSSKTETFAHDEGKWRRLTANAATTAEPEPPPVEPPSAGIPAVGTTVSYQGQPATVVEVHENGDLLLQLAVGQTLVGLEDLDAAGPRGQPPLGRTIEDYDIRQDGKGRWLVYRKGRAGEIALPRQFTPEEMAGYRERGINVPPVMEVVVFPTKRAAKAALETMLAARATPQKPATEEKPVRAIDLDQPIGYQGKPRGVVDPRTQVSALTPDEHREVRRILAELTEMQFSQARGQFGGTFEQGRRVPRERLRGNANAPVYGDIVGDLPPATSKQLRTIIAEGLERGGHASVWWDRVVSVAKARAAGDQRYLKHASLPPEAGDEPGAPWWEAAFGPAPAPVDEFADDAREPDEGGDTSFEFGANVGRPTAEALPSLDAARADEIRVAAQNAKSIGLAEGRTLTLEDAYKQARREVPGLTREEFAPAWARVNEADADIFGAPDAEIPAGIATGANPRHMTPEERAGRVPITSTSVPPPTPVVDVGPDGGVQPRLPGAEGVRDQEVPTPKFDLPFSLTPEVAKPAAQQTRELFPPTGGNYLAAADGAIGAASGRRPGTLPVRPDGVTRPVEVPELIHLVTQLLGGTTKVVQKFRKAEVLAAFRGIDRGQILLRADLFKRGREQELWAAICHEVGHLVDYFPDFDLRRGNLLGRLYTLHKFLKGTFTTPGGETISNATVRDELKALSAWWRPWDPDTANKQTKAYRNSSKELYADAVSVLLNSPGELQERAPVFYGEFFAALDRKPDVADAYFAIQEAMSGTPEELAERRLTRQREMFDRANTKSVEYDRLRRQKEAEGFWPWWTKLTARTYEKLAPLRRLRRKDGDWGGLPPGRDPIYALEEIPKVKGRQKVFAEQFGRDIYETLKQAGTSWTEFGMFLFQERVFAGDRTQLANPQGASPEVAAMTYRALHERLTPEQWTLLQDLGAKFRAEMYTLTKEGHDIGFYTDELFESLQPDSYVTFKTVDSIPYGVSATIRHQHGTLSDIINPAEATLAKAMVMMKAFAHQRAKTQAYQLLKDKHPELIEDVRVDAKGEPYSRPTRRDWKVVTFREKGHIRGFYTDPYMADAINMDVHGKRIPVVAELTQAFRSLVIVYNLAFQSYNLIKDPFRAWPNTPTLTVGQYFLHLPKAYRLGRVRAFGMPKTPKAKYEQAQKDLEEAEKAGILGITYNEMMAHDDLSAESLANLLHRYHVAGLSEYETWLGKKLKQAGEQVPAAEVAGRVVNWVSLQTLERIKNLGDLIETMPKAVGIYHFTTPPKPVSRRVGEAVGMLAPSSTPPPWAARSISEIPADVKSHIRRKVGSPDFEAGGYYKSVLNDALVFSNAIYQAVAADVEVATSPKTAFTFWYRHALIGIVPKIIMFGALMGWPPFDKDSRRRMSAVTDYYLSTRIVIPVDEDENGDVSALLLPVDDTSRILGALAWKLLNWMGDQPQTRSIFESIIDYTGGQLPSVSPYLAAIMDTAVMASGGNPRDRFRRVDLLTRDEQAARSAGAEHQLHAWRKFVGWEFQKIGGSVIWTFTPGGDQPREQTLGQRILKLPLVGPIARRFVYIGQRGHGELVRDVSTVEAGELAARRQRERPVIRQHLEAFRPAMTQPITEETRQRLRDEADRILTELYPDDDATRKERRESVRNQLRLAFARGQDDDTIAALTQATTTRQKLAVLEELRKLLPPATFNRVVDEARALRLISGPIVRKAKE